jgi:Animal haem peroxidase
MKKLLKTTLIAAGPLASVIAHAAPEASIVNVNPPNGSVVSTPQTVVRGKVSHDIYPVSRIAATFNGKPLPLDPNGNFSVPVTLKPGDNDFVLRVGMPNPRQQTTVISSYLDGSMVYGSDAKRANALRSFKGGALKTSHGNLPPLNTEGLANATANIVPDDELFLAGDVRANENIELASIHTLFLREHNRIAAAIAGADPRLNDEQIYQQARRIVTAEIQVITYREFLPALLGDKAIQPYRGYNPNVNAGIANEFSTAAYRIGHSLINDDVEFLDNDGNPVRDGLPLAFAFFNPNPVKETGPDPILKYLATDNAQEVDTQLVEGLRNFLFGPPGAGGLDLASLNIQRGRDHGLADYNTVRKAYGMPPVTNVSQITRNPSLQAKLLSLYPKLDSLDLWVAGLAEDHLPGSSVGPTFQRIIVDQFQRTRDGDSNWHERNFSGRQLAALQATRLSDIIRRNTSITKIQDNVFFFNKDTLAGLTPKAGVLPPDLVRGPAPGTPPASLDGTGNNPFHFSWGASNQCLLRLAPAGYADAVSSPAGPERPSARLVSNTVSSLTTTAPNSRSMSSWVYGWGQFIDHDLGLTETGDEPFDIQVPAGDPSFDPNGTGTVTIPMTRADHDASTGSTSPAVTQKALRITFKPRPPRP